MRHYGVRHEAEIISGYITKFMSRQYAKEGKLFELRNEIVHTIRAMRHRYEIILCFFNTEFSRYLRYIELFWHEFYLPSISVEAAVDEQESSASLWKTVSSKLTSHNQLDHADFYQKNTIQVEQKGSAWFYVTYQEQRKKKRTAVNKRKEVFSFAWLIYPVLFHIYDNPRQASVSEDQHADREPRKKKRGRGNRRRNKGRT